MKATAKRGGILIPSKMLKGTQTADIRWEANRIVVEPIKVKGDSLFDIGKNPGKSGNSRIAQEHDKHLYGR